MFPPLKLKTTHLSLSATYEPYVSKKVARFNVCINKVPHRALVKRMVNDEGEDIEGEPIIPRRVTKYLDDPKEGWTVVQTSELKAVKGLSVALLGRKVFKILNSPSSAKKPRRPRPNWTLPCSETVKEKVKEGMVRDLLEVYFRSGVLQEGEGSQAAPTDQAQTQTIDRHTQDMILEGMPCEEKADEPMSGQDEKNTAAQQKADNEEKDAAEESRHDSDSSDDDCGNGGSLLMTQAEPQVSDASDDDDDDDDDHDDGEANNYENNHNNNGNIDDDGAQEGNGISDDDNDKGIGDDDENDSDSDNSNPFGLLTQA